MEKQEPAIARNYNRLDIDNHFRKQILYPLSNLEVKILNLKILFSQIVNSSPPSEPYAALQHRASHLHTTGHPPARPSLRLR